MAQVAEGGYEELLLLLQGADLFRPPATFSCFFSGHSCGITGHRALNRLSWLAAEAA